MRKGQGRSERARLRSFITALVAGDKPRAFELAREHFDANGSRVALFADLIHPAQYEIGEMWYAGRIGVAQEHRATAIVEEIAGRLPPTPTRGRPARGRCVLAAVEAEQHVVGLRLLAASLEDDGWEVALLGGRTPIPDLIDYVTSRRPRFVGLSAAYRPSAPSLKKTIAAVRRSGARVLVGGPAFNRNRSLWEQVGADGHGPDARQAVVLARAFSRR